MRRKKNGLLEQFFILMFGVILISLIVLLLGIFIMNSHGAVSIETIDYTESARELVNPNRGFYCMCGFVVSDVSEDYNTLVNEKIGVYEKQSLAMIQINLREYKDKPISKKALANIEELFQALEMQEKQYIIRFLYDWNGNNDETEPEDVNIILNHMRQLENIFQKYEHIIFVHQGIFIGNWGEMNGTKHLAHMQELALQLETVTDDSTYLAVRMPAQWRKITGLAEPFKKNLSGSGIANRLSLFNDGMLGSTGDYGTYGTLSRVEVGDFTHWNREEELAFQEELCKYVPNGGEVIIDNPVNDFENAIKDLATMHVTYLNRQYDQNVLNKWAEAIVTENGCFNGMDGLSYVERHLGYRLLINKADFSYDFWPDILTVNVTLQNVGFAPMYRQPEIYCVVSDADGTEIRSFEIQEDVRILTGGNETEKLLTISKDISLTGFEAGAYNVYFYMKDTASGKQILLANEQDEEVLGYKLGQITIEPLINPITGKEFNFKSIINTWLH